MNAVKALMIPLFITFNYHLEAKEFHVAKQGNDQNPGSEAAPFKSISAAARMARAGDTVTVHEGIYRERVNPVNGGTNDLSRIVYQAAEEEKVVIKGSERITNWEKVEGSVWKVVLPNDFFGDYNPYVDLLTGDWLDKKGMDHHTGEVFLNGKSLFEKATLEDVKASRPYPDARDPEASVYTWCCEVDDNHTTLWANFQGYDPNEEMVEINVRESCFYPDKPGVNYITVRGFRMDQAATQWAAPTAEQIGLIGTHWSKGWIIENNVVSNSKSVGISLGKDRATGQNVWMNNPVKDGATHYNEVIFRALEIGWSKEKIGSHVVRNNVIFDCGQAGIVGSLGGVYSQIYDNHIYDIWTKRIFSGAEMAGIKIHASIDMLIKHNRIHNTGRGIWIDWMAQGTRITGNLLYDNTTDDLFAEVNHGPYLVDNNLFLSELSFRDMSEGGAFVHNLFAGKIEMRQELNRFTPYHLPHSTWVAGLRNTYGGDNRFFNNIFLGGDPGQERFEETYARFYGLHGYRLAGFENHAEGNVYYHGAKPGLSTERSIVMPDSRPSFELEEKEGSVFLKLLIDDAVRRVETSLVTTAKLGVTIVSEAIYEKPDGSPYALNMDYQGHARDESNPLPGPFEGLEEGMGTYIVW
jgi:hypothetical protein